MSNGRERNPPDQSEAKNETSRNSTTRNITIKDDRLDSRTLFGTARQIMIEHGVDTYILRLTSQNKLILTK